MLVIEFKDGVVVELSENMEINVVGFSTDDVEFNTICAINDDVRIFNIINDRLGGILTA